MKSKRQLSQVRRQRKKRFLWFGMTGVVLIVLAWLGYAVWSTSRPTPVYTDESVAIMPDLSHVPEGADPGPYNSDPPTSGRHYEATLNAGFYQEGDVQGPYPEGYIVHNLEHGYVIFWYNCGLLNAQECNGLEEQIREVMAKVNNFKVIAYPWKSIDVPVVMTSWGRMLRFDEFDPDQAQEFVIRNRNKAPEPNAP